MNISPQDKAFLITFSSACVLVLVFFFITLSPFDQQLAAEEFIDIPIIEEPDQPEELQKEEVTAQNEPISHQLKNESRLQNEAEKFFSQEDQVREALQEKQDVESEAAEAENDYSDYKERIEALRKQVENAGAEEKKPEPDRKTSATSRRTTISYILKERNAVAIPNPVYTCDAVGKVVINIAVSGNGSVTRTVYNKAASTTANGCLVDQALDYARRAIFNSASRSAQLGSITFEFQG